MAISSSPSPFTISPSFSSSSSSPVRFATIRPGRLLLPARHLTVSSRLYSSNSDDPPGGSVFPEDNSFGGEFQYGFPSLPFPKKGTPVFVTLPLESINAAGKLMKKKALGASFMAMTAAGVEGVVVEVWWGIVERQGPGVYDWGGYLDIAHMAGRYGLKVRAIMAFHQCGELPGNSFWIPLPRWVLEEMDKEPDLAYTDRFGRRNREYISLGCDLLPVLKGRSPIQAYSDFMRNFRDTFRDFLGVVITEIQIGMGPAGELRYPSRSSEKPTWGWPTRELGEFQCYDKYMIASLNACAEHIGRREWGNGGPLGAANLNHIPGETNFFKSDDSWDTSYGKFFLEWYSGMLLLHGERLSIAAENIFLDTNVKIAAKISGIFSHYGTKSHPSELTAGYYNTSIRDGYLPIARMLGRYRMKLCCSFFDMKDSEENPNNPNSSLESFLKQLVFAARLCGIPIVGENSSENSMTRIDDEALKRVVTSTKSTLYSVGILYDPFFSFNFVRMNKNLFEPQNWTRFTRFVKRMSDSRNFRAQLNRYASCKRKKLVYLLDISFSDCLSYFFNLEQSFKMLLKFCKVPAYDCVTISH